MCGPGFGGMYGYGGLWSIIMGIIGIAVVVGAVWLVVYLVRTTGRRGPASESGDALETLRRRYARGEITHDQFEQMKRDLTS
ncbi:MAG: SHOCT domain-containing protein [candidate division WOR-3 bacterium]|nr:SHOCT domain-containing protein [candidate division WOR-3 bacterium]